MVVVVVVLRCLTNDSVLKTLPYYQRKLDQVVIPLPMQQYLVERGARTLINAFIPQLAIAAPHA